MKTKRCGCCKQIKPIDLFNNCKRSKDGKSYRCRECEKIAKQKHRTTEKYVITRKAYESTENYKLKRKLYRQSDKGREAARAYKNTATYKNSVKRYNDSEIAKQRVREYRKSEAGKINAKRYWSSDRGREIHKREKYLRRRLQNNNGRLDLTSDDWKEIKKSQNYRCAKCGKKTKLTQDHIIPVSRGGEHTKANIQGLCFSCNCSKGSKLMAEWNNALKEAGMVTDYFIDTESGGN